MCQAAFEGHTNLNVGHYARTLADVREVGAFLTRHVLNPSTLLKVVHSLIESRHAEGWQG
jgi:hypothetical protein